MDESVAKRERDKFLKQLQELSNSVVSASEAQIQSSAEVVEKLDELNEMMSELLDHIEGWEGLISGFLGITPQSAQPQPQNSGLLSEFLNFLRRFQP